jgi:hypothetical protein
LVRRAAFAASGIPDQTEYIERLLPAGADRDAWLTAYKRSDYESIAYTVARGAQPADVVGMTLPTDFPRAEAFELVKRGIAELSLVRVP